MSCSECKCICPSACDILAGCFFEHELIKPYKENVKILLEDLPEYKIPKKIVRILEALRPPRVSHFQIERYWGLLKHGIIDLDVPEKSGLSEKEIRLHLKIQRSFKRKLQRSNRKELLDLLGINPVKFYKNIKENKPIPYE